MTNSNHKRAKKIKPKIEVETIEQFKLITYRELHYVPSCKECKWNNRLSKLPCSKCDAMALTSMINDIYYFEEIGE